MKIILPLLIALITFPFEKANGVTTLTGCAGGDFGAECSLAELHGGGTLQIDGYLFDNWNVNVVSGSLNTIQVTAIADPSQSPKPGLLFEGPGVVSNESIGFEMSYDVSNTGSSPGFAGYQQVMVFNQLIGTANGFSAMEVIDNILNDTSGSDLEIANPEPTVTHNTTTLSDDFTDCDNDITVSCPGSPDPALPRVVSQDFRVTTNLDVSGGSSGSLNSFSLSQRFPIYDPPPYTLTGCNGGDFGTECSLAELGNGGTIQFNGVLFSNWVTSVVSGSLSHIRITPIGVNGSSPGLLFEGPGVTSNDNIGFEVFYDVTAVSGTPKITGYQFSIGFDQRTGTAGGFAAMQLSDKNINDSIGRDLLIANPEPTVNVVTPQLNDWFTDCDNDVTVTCPTVIDPSLPRIVSSGITVSINMDIGGGGSGSFNSFGLSQKFNLLRTSRLCFPIRGISGNVAVICL